MVTVEGNYQEVSTVEPLLGAEHIDSRQTFSSPATQGSGYMDQSWSHVGHVSSGIDSPAGHSLDESNTHVSPASGGTSDISLHNDSSLSASTTSDPDGTHPGDDVASNSDSPDSASDIVVEQPDRNASFFYPGICLVALSLGYIYFRYIRR